MRPIANGQSSSRLVCTLSLTCCLCTKRAHNNVCSTYDLATKNISTLHNIEYSDRNCEHTHTTHSGMMVTTKTTIGATMKGKSIQVYTLYVHSRRSHTLSPCTKKRNSKRNQKQQQHQNRFSLLLYSFEFSLCLPFVYCRTLFAVNEMKG